MAAAATGIRHDSAGEELWRLRKNFADDALSLVVWLAFAWAVYTWTFPLTAPTFPVPYLLFILYFTRLQFRLLMVPVWAANTLNLLSERRKIPSTNGLGAPPFLVFIAAYKAQGSIGSVLEALKHQDYPEDRFEVYVVTQEVENTEKWQRYECVGLRLLSPDPVGRTGNSRNRDPYPDRNAEKKMDAQAGSGRGTESAGHSLPLFRNGQEQNSRPARRGADRGVLPADS